MRTTATNNRPKNINEEEVGKGKLSTTANLAMCRAGRCAARRQPKCTTLKRGREEDVHRSKFPYTAQKRSHGCMALR